MIHIVAGCDHAGFPLKKFLLENLQYHWEDKGCFTTDSVDYPKVAEEVAKVVASDGKLGLLICGSGMGMSIAANKVKGIRAAVVSDVTAARLARQHNDANILCLGARLIGTEVAKEICEVFYSTPFLKDRHEKRVKQIGELEQRCTN